MKANELMMYDWVHIAPAAPKRIEYDTKVIGIGEDIILKRGETGVDCIPYDRVVPIPLTTEILEANGIKFQFGAVWYQIHNDKIQLAWENNGDTIRLCVDYVQELQHALRLCGLNELADNFKI